NPFPFEHVLPEYDDAPPSRDRTSSPDARDRWWACVPRVQGYTVRRGTESDQTRAPDFLCGVCARVHTQGAIEQRARGECAVGAADDGWRSRDGDGRRAFRTYAARGRDALVGVHAGREPNE